MKAGGKINDGWVGKGTFTGAGEIRRLENPNLYLTLFIHPGGNTLLGKASLPAGFESRMPSI